MPDFKTLDDIDMSGKRVLVRADMNVPMKDGLVTDATRIERSLPTLDDLAAAGAKVIVLSHFGRPKGQRNPELSLKPVAQALEKAAGRRVVFGANCVGDAAAKAIASAGAGEIVMLENLRFHAEEEKNDAAFAQALADLADVYVNDAFSCAHRAHASTEAIAHLLPACAGRLMQAELDALEGALGAPERPVAAVVGGAKISTKMAVLGHLTAKVDQLIIGGGMANTFLYAQGVDVGKSLCETEMAEQAQAILADAAAAGCEVVLPVDATVATRFEAGAPNQVVPVGAVPADAMILDVGPASVDDLVERLSGCRTVVWNGPLGAFEISPFDAGTNAVAREAARLTQAGKLLSVAGGGDTVAALANAGVVERFSYVSTAGGAFLEWLEGRTLPGVAALAEAAHPSTSSG
ncbi:MAG: phosphoglycerate kinase [Alphaproteobacteria bacterium]